MAEVDQVKRRNGVVLSLLFVLPSLLLALFWWPRPAVPIELPSLALPLGDAARAIADEDALAEHAPDGESETERREAYLEQGRAELRGAEVPVRAHARLDRLASAARRLLEAEGEEALDAVRARDVLRMEGALGGAGTEEDRAAELGVFPVTLERWNAIEGGVRIAPRLVVRALAAARWNAIHDRPLTEGMRPLHQRAYHGWLALHGAIGWSELRAGALQRYAAAGGPRTHEALGVLLYLEGEPELAAPEFAASYAMTGNLRVRNHWLAALGP